MTWTVAAGDVTTYAYIIEGKKMTVAFNIKTSTVGGTPSTQLLLKIPASKTATKAMETLAIVVDNGTTSVGQCFVTAGGTNIGIAHLPLANLSASTDNTLVQGIITFEIN
jgi:hypothetical protein